MGGSLSRYGAFYGVMPGCETRAGGCTKLGIQQVPLNYRGVLVNFSSVFKKIIILLSRM